jgi:S1-C subfamily serine protease
LLKDIPAAPFLPHNSKDHLAFAPVQENDMVVRCLRFPLLPSVILSVIFTGAARAEENVYKKALKSTVWIVVPMGGGKVGMASGSVVDTSKRLILTNYHVVGDQKECVIFFPMFGKNGELIPEKEKYLAALQKGGGLKATVFATDQHKDLALVQLAKLPAGTTALKLAAGSPSPSDKVHSIGSPGVSGALFNYTDGTVKAVYQKKWKALRSPNDPNPLELEAKVIESSSGINKGDSGGPLMNSNAELVGVTQGALMGGADTRPISFFIDVSEVKALLKSKGVTPRVAPDAATEDKTATTASTSSPTKEELEKRENDAQFKLYVAKELAKAGKNEKARERYQEIVDLYKGTMAADEAQKLLETK